MTDVERLDTETAKLRAETAKLHAEAAKLEAEQRKLMAEGLKFTRETFWYPMIAASGLFAGVGTIVVALLKLAGKL